MKPRLTIDPFAKKNTSCNSNDEEIFHNSRYIGLNYKSRHLPYLEIKITLIIIFYFVYRFDEKEYKHKFKILSRIHVVLESLIHIENILEVKMGNLTISIS